LVLANDLRDLFLAHRVDGERILAGQQPEIDCFTDRHGFGELEAVIEVLEMSCDSDLAGDVPRGDAGGPDILLDLLQRHALEFGDRDALAVSKEANSGLESQLLRFGQDDISFLAWSGRLSTARSCVVRCSLCG